MKFTGKWNSTVTLPVTGTNLRSSHKATIRRARKPSLTRQRRSGVPVRRGSRPVTPLLQRSVEDQNKERCVAVEDDDDCNNQINKWPTMRCQERRRSVGEDTVRKLAAGVWRLQVPDSVYSGGDKRSRDALEFQVQLKIFFFFVTKEWK